MYNLEFLLKIELANQSMGTFKGRDYVKLSHSPVTHSAGNFNSLSLLMFETGGKLLQSH